MKLYTIGFTQKRAATFFGLLREHGVRRLVDVRLKPDGQLAGFAKKDELPFFLYELAAGLFPITWPARLLLIFSRAEWPRLDKGGASVQLPSALSLSKSADTAPAPIG